MSPDGDRVAYVVQKPESSSNENVDELYVRSIGRTEDGTSSALLTLPEIAAVQWFGDNRHLAALMRSDSHLALAEIDASTGQYQIIYSTNADITDYSLNRNGSVIAIAVHIPDDHTSPHPTERDEAMGYRINLQTELAPIRPQRRVEILRREHDGHWTVTDHVAFKSPLSGDEITQIFDNHATHINLSPNGRYLLLDNWESTPLSSLPMVWRESKMAQYIADRFTGFVVTYLYDLSTKQVSLPLPSPVVRNSVWSPDSESFAMRALPPVGSQWEEQDLRKGAANDHSTHLFVVNMNGHSVSEVLDRVENPPLAWTGDKRILIRDEAGAIQSFTVASGEWKAQQAIHIPLSHLSPYGPLVTNGTRFVGEYETATTSPRLFEYAPPSKDVSIVAELDPEIDAYVLPHAEEIQWTTSTGYHAKGLLLIPPHYDPTRRYPLVVEDGSIQYAGEFVCDSGGAHVSSFVRGILADQGVMYLMRIWPGIEDWENNYFPKGYPGTLAETVFRMDLVESAVRYLNSRHMIDATKIGIIGFSRGGWYAEYALTHSAIHFAAATITDNIQLSLGEYWYLHSLSIMDSSESVYGGPPYGESLRNWLEYSISFNLDKVCTPIMMEVMGYGAEDDDPERLPDNLAVHNEVFVGLSRLNKPVEMYYYPNEQHQPDHPLARIASLQRNLDWFRFWLQGYERQSPDALDEYRRWEQMRSATPMRQDIH
jgi:dipeptidyl aminopeptidase/acylaminoacyl peptidase